MKIAAVNTAVAGSRAALLIVGLLLQGCTTADAVHTPPSPQESARTQWEYRFESAAVSKSGGLLLAESLLREALDKAGRDGWELVSITLLSPPAGDTSTDSKVLAVLKRARRPQ